MEIQNLPWYGQMLVFLIVGVILLGIFYFVHYQPVSAEIDGIVQESEKLEEEIRLAERNRDKLKNLEEENIRNQATLMELKTIMPDKKEISGILKNIQLLASNARLRMPVFTPSKEVARDIYVEWPIFITLQGNYHNLGIFFDQVSRLRKIFNINGLHIRPDAHMTAEYSIHADFTATTYIYQERKTPVKPKLPPRRAAPPPRAESGGGELTGV